MAVFVSSPRVSEPVAASLSAMGGEAVVSRPATPLMGSRNTKDSSRRPVGRHVSGRGRRSFGDDQSRPLRKSTKHEMKAARGMTQKHLFP
ncbi:hypothetical protein E2C01_078846 [Portunus trituberculatus]|uniref:Uncharacterized protein n=1 Tax=Portunus trituberculatus TaxID=210409 RepID=A0A5B7IPT6_PORTR|nr:hypothetical protein [Portunus trituberculatus]